MSEQKGAFRVNCIDCLDRTNVVQVHSIHVIVFWLADHLMVIQSAFARTVLNKQLGAVALLNPEIEGTTETDIVFNDGT